MVVRYDITVADAVLAQSAHELRLTTNNANAPVLPRVALVDPHGDTVSFCTGDAPTDGLDLLRGELLTPLLSFGQVAHDAFEEAGIRQR